MKTFKQFVTKLKKMKPKLFANAYIPDKAIHYRHVNNKKHEDNNDAQ